MKRRRLVVTPQAHRDLLSIVAWYRHEMGPATAAKTLRSLRAGMVAATGISRQAARREDLPDGYFRVVAKAHLVIFKIDGDEVQIVRVVHASRDIPPLLS